MLLDKKTTILHNILSKESTGEYKVLEMDNLRDRLPKKYATISYEEISNILKYLKDLAYIDIKYLDENELCFAILPKSRIYEEHLLEDKKLSRRFALMIALSGIISGICGFCGAFLSHIILG